MTKKAKPDKPGFTMKCLGCGHEAPPTQFYTYYQGGCDTCGDGSSGCQNAQVVWGG